MRRRRSARLKWAVGTVAPWALSVGLLVSFTASAGQTEASDQEPSSLVHRVAPAPDSALAEGPSLLIAASAFRLPGLALSSAVTLASLNFDPPERRLAIDPRQPRDDMKRAAAAFPAVDRSAKGDLLPALRPSLSRRAAPEDVARLVFGDTQPGLISAGVAPDQPLELPLEGDGLGGPALGFEPHRVEDGLTDPALSEASPSSLKPRIISPRQAELHLESIDGSTPTASARAGSTTPAVRYAVVTLAAPEPPALIALAPAEPSRRMIGRERSSQEPAGSREIYTALITEGDMARQQRCLAEAVYFEARSESEEGRAAVAQVVLNRVKSGLYPDTVCGVVYQNRHRHLACQFTFACEGKALKITEPEPWRAAVRIAREVYDGTTYLADVGASTHYHANYVRPYWARKLKKMDTIGQHIFYKLRPGQT